MTTSNVGFRTAILITVVLMLGFVPASSAQEKSSAAAGEALFKSHCIMCHGADGTGNTTLGKQLQAPDLHSKEIQKLTDSEIKNVILNGKGNMPPFDGQIAGNEAEQIAHYVHSLAKTK